VKKERTTGEYMEKKAIMIYNFIILYLGEEILCVRYI